MIELPAIDLKWYALRAKARKEEMVWKQASSQGVEVFFPRLKFQPVNPRARKWKPYFPGYLFVRADLTQIGQSIFQWMPHSLGLVTFGGEPAVVPDNLLYAIRQRVNEIAAAGGEVFDGLKSGDPVQIAMGPFEGYEGIFDERIPGGERVRVLLRFLNSRHVPVELDASQIKKMAKRK